MTYYTVFSIVPVLVVVLGILKGLGYLAHLVPAVPVAAPERSLSDNGLLGRATKHILSAANQTLRVESGLVGLAALIYGVARLFKNIENTIDDVAGAQESRPRYYRLLGYLVLLLLPGILAAMLSALIAIGAGLSHLIGTLPHLRIVAGGLAIMAAVWIGLATLYAAAARARIGLSSAAVGGAVAAILLTLVLWAFVRFQIGASHASALQSGFAAGPVLLLWIYSSWYVVLIGAEIAIGHGLDRVLVHGAGGWRLDAAGQRAASVAIMAQVARATQAAPPEAAPVTLNELARTLRLFPRAIQPVCRKLVAGGLLKWTDGAGYRLARDPRDITVASILEELARDRTVDRTLDGARTQIEAQLGPRGRAALADGAPTPARPQGGTPTLRDLLLGDGKTEKNVKQIPARSVP